MFAFFVSWITRVYEIEMLLGYFATKIESDQLKNDRGGTHRNQSVAFVVTVSITSVHFILIFCYAGFVHPSVFSVVMYR